MTAYLAHILPAGVRGLIAAAALAAMMSTFDSYLLCWSSILVNDIVAPVRPRLDDAGKIKLIRIAIVVCGVFVLLWGYIYDPPETIFRFMAITGTMYSASVLLTTAMGLYWKKANTAGTLASLVVAGILPLFAIFVKDAASLPAYLQWLASDKEVAIATFVLSLTAIVAVSLLTQKSSPPKALVFPEED